MSGFAYGLMKLRAMALLTAGARDAAADTFGAMLARWPDDPYALASRAHLREQQGLRTQAIADQQRLVEVHPARSAADWFNLAYLLQEAERFDEAEPAFRRALELDPSLDRAWYGLGLLLIRRQRLDEAVVALERNTKLQPMSPYGWYQLARVQVDRECPEEARKIIRRLKGFDPKVADQLARETHLQP